MKNYNRSFLLQIEDTNEGFNEILESQLIELSNLLGSQVAIEEIEPVELDEKSLDYINTHLLKDEDMDPIEMLDDMSTDYGLRNLTELQAAIIAGCLVDSYKFELSDLDVSSKEWNNFSAKLKMVVNRVSDEKLQKALDKTITKVVKEFSKASPLRPV